MKTYRTKRLSLVKIRVKSDCPIEKYVMELKSITFLIEKHENNDSLEVYEVKNYIY